MSEGAQVCLLCVFILVASRCTWLQCPAERGAFPLEARCVTLPAWGRSRRHLESICTMLLNWLGGWVMLAQAGTRRLTAEVECPLEEFGEHRGALWLSPLSHRFSDFDSWLLTTSRAHGPASQPHTGQWVTGNDKTVSKAFNREAISKPVPRASILPILLEEEARAPRVK